MDSGAMEQEKNDFSSRIFGRGGSVSNTTCLKKGPMPKDLQKHLISNDASRRRYFLESENKNLMFYHKSDVKERLCPVRQKLLGVP